MRDFLRHKECDFIIISLVFDLHGQGKSRFVGLQHGHRVLERRNNTSVITSRPTGVQGE